MLGAAAGGRSSASCARGISASLHVIACVEEPALIRKILVHVRAREELAVFWRLQSDIGTGLARIESETVAGLGLLVSA